MRRLRSLIAGLPARAVHTPRATHHLFGPTPLPVAHRGWSARAPENTMAAFEAAAAAGYAIELDVGLTRDRVPIILHDDTLDRTTTGVGRADEVPWPVIADLDAGRWFDPAFAGERVPTLDQVLEVLGGRVLLDIEIKAPGPRSRWPSHDLGEVVAGRIAHHGLEDRVVVTSFDPFVLDAVRRAAPRIPRGQLYGTFEGAELTDLQKRALRQLWLTGSSRPDLLAPEEVLLRPDYARRLRDKGYPLAAWTVNDADRMRALLDMGVSLLITDHPDLAETVIGERT